MLICTLEAKMRELNKIVIPKVSANWVDVAYALGYEIHTVKSIRDNHNGSARKCCRELFEDWLTTSNGARPKTWQTLLDCLKDVEELASATKDITDNLIQMDSQM